MSDSVLHAYSNALQAVVMTVVAVAFVAVTTSAAWWWVRLTQEFELVREGGPLHIDVSVKQQADPKGAPQ